MLCTSQTYLDSPTLVGLFGLKRRQAATICVTYPPNPLSVKGAYVAWQVKLTSRVVRGNRDNREFRESP